MASVLRADVTGVVLDVDSGSGSLRSGTAFDAFSRCTATDPGTSDLRSTARAGVNGRTADGVAAGATASAVDSLAGIGS
ncbi:hypothetical protein [Streptacidiphilus sp. MAP5-3]|uniref:hypothetical protein n=1 Tax=unclassified Streptacidiphilus TaxID=2643834 RepID=UPI0035146939